MLLSDKRKTKALISLRGCAGWSAPLLFAHPRRQVFLRRGPYKDVRFGSKFYRQNVGIPIVTNCAPLVADLFLFCYENDFMFTLSDNNQADDVEAFDSTLRYLEDLLNIDNPYFEHMVSQIYPIKIQLNKANSSDNEAPFSDLELSIITNCIFSI